MKLGVFAIRDRALDAFMVPQFLQSVGIAIRSFGDALNGAKQEDSPLRAHPEDFDLYHLGDFDPETGLFATGVPKQVAIGKDIFIRSEK